MAAAEEEEVEEAEEEEEVACRSAAQLVEYQRARAFTSSPPASRAKGGIYTPADNYVIN